MIEGSISGSLVYRNDMHAVYGTELFGLLRVFQAGGTGVVAFGGLKVSVV